jgi:hypothetical protein
MEGINNTYNAYNTRGGGGGGMTEFITPIVGFGVSALLLYIGFVCINMYERYYIATCDPETTTDRIRCTAAKKENNKKNPILDTALTFPILGMVLAVCYIAITIIAMSSRSVKLHNIDKITATAAANPVVPVNTLETA